MVDRSRLGRGLDFFLSGSRPPQQAVPQSVAAPPQAEPRTEKAQEKPVDGLQQIPIGSLVANANQPRREFPADSIAQLAESIRSNGILQPILVRPSGQNFEVIAGERRWRAATLAGLSHVPALIQHVDTKDSAVFALVENVQREDLNAIDKAIAFKKLMAVLGATQEEVARKVGFDRSTVANIVRLLDLPEEVQAYVSRGTLSMGHARCLLSLSSAEEMVATATRAIKDGWSVRKLESEVKACQARLVDAGSGKPAETKGRPVWIAELEESLLEALGSPVSIRYTKKRSQITIECGSREDFERVYQRLKNA